MGNASGRTSEGLAASRARGPGRPSDARPRIIVAAGELFAKMGYHGASMRDISAHAKVPLASITYFFQTKQNLFLECLLESLEVYFDYKQMFAPEPVEKSASAASAAIQRKIVAVFHRFYREEKIGHEVWQPSIIISAVMSREPFHIAPMGQMIGASREYFAPRLLKIKPKMTPSEMFAWHLALWAMVSFPTTSRQLTLARLGERRLTSETVSAFATYAAHLMLRSLKGDVTIDFPSLRNMPQGPPPSRPSGPSA